MAHDIQSIGAYYIKNKNWPGLRGSTGGSSSITPYLTYGPKFRSFAERTMVPGARMEDPTNIRDQGLKVRCWGIIGRSSEQLF